MISERQFGSGALQKWVPPSTFTFAPVVELLASEPTGLSDLFKVPLLRQQQEKHAADEYRSRYDVHER